MLWKIKNAKYVEECKKRINKAYKIKFVQGKVIQYSLVNMNLI